MEESIATTHLFSTSTVEVLFAANILSVHFFIFIYNLKKDNSNPSIHMRAAGLLGVYLQVYSLFAKCTFLFLNFVRNYA